MPPSEANAVTGSLFFLQFETMQRPVQGGKMKGWVCGVCVCVCVGGGGVGGGRGGKGGLVCRYAST
jgi:hypothetical protein